MDEKEIKSDHDLLVKLNSDMSWVKTMLSNHLLHHKKATYILLTFIGGLVVTLGGMVITLILALV
ncbi:MAG: hypothetical protein ACTSQY_02780 [Candidatus Odinarchaeia archaeon]